jgi:hypothetical protein
MSNQNETTSVTPLTNSLLDRLSSPDPAQRSQAAPDAMQEILRLRGVVNWQFAELAENSAHRNGGLLVLCFGALVGFVVCGLYLWTAGFLHLSHACR